MIWRYEHLTPPDWFVRAGAAKPGPFRLAILTLTEKLPVDNRDKVGEKRWITCGKPVCKNRRTLTCQWGCCEYNYAQPDGGKKFVERFLPFVKLSVIAEKRFEFPAHFRYDGNCNEHNEVFEC